MSEFTKQELDQLMLRIRHASRSSAIPLNQGADDELIEARAKMPEPTRHKPDFYRVRLRPPPFIGFRRDLEDFPVFEFVRDAAFHRVLVKSHEGATFYAWQNSADGRHYL